MSGDRAAIIVGVGEAREEVPTDPREGSSTLDLAVQAAIRACDDAGARNAVAGAINEVFAIRTFADTVEHYAHPFGTVTNMPQAIARRIGARPSHLVYAIAGGQSPQESVGEISTAINNGETDKLTLLVGSEAQANVKAALRLGLALDWSDDTDGPVEDRGAQLSDIITPAQTANGLTVAGALYALLENARRHHLGMNRRQYAAQIGRLLAPMSRQAANHPCAMFPKAFTIDEIASSTHANPMLFDPYTKAMMAKDGVNQACAILITSVGKARALGIDEARWIYVDSTSNVSDIDILNRETLWHSPAMQTAYRVALRRAGISNDDLSVMDLYSCFPVAVFAACDALGIRPDDPRGLTVTGGMPFFGGPGNNYALHAIANVVLRLRERDGGHGLVGANGGILSKHAVGVYSRTPSEKRRVHRDDDLDSAMRAAMPSQQSAHRGRSSIEAYTVQFDQGQPARGYMIGRSEDGSRFFAATEPADRRTPERMMQVEPIGRAARVTSSGMINQFVMEG